MIAVRWMVGFAVLVLFFFSSRRRHTSCGRDWSSDVCSSDLHAAHGLVELLGGGAELSADALALPIATGQQLGPSAQELDKAMGGVLGEMVANAERSEERRVGKERRSRVPPGASQKHKA